MLIAMMAIVLTACQTPTQMSELPRITLTSDGGFTGRGTGGVAIEGGRVTATLGQKSCEGTLTDDERKELAKLVSFHDSKAAGHGSPDAIHYTLTAGDHTASWYGEDAPKDVAPLFRLLWRIRDRVSASC